MAQFLKLLMGKRFLINCTPFLMAGLLLTTQHSHAQKTTLNDTIIQERLVALALNGPAMKIGEHQNKINEFQLKRQKDSWLNLLAFSLNYNDQTFGKNQNQAQTVVFPRYFFGLTIPLGTLLSRTEVKAAREGIEIGKYNQEQLKRTLRADVLTKYRQYKSYGELIAIQNELMNDVDTELSETEEKFKKGTVTIEAYNIAQRNRNNERAKLINLRLQQDLVKIDIEKVIGTSLESVLR